MTQRALTNMVVLALAFSALSLLLVTYAVAFVVMNTREVKKDPKETAEMIRALNRISAAIEKK